MKPKYIKIVNQTFTFFISVILILLFTINSFAINTTFVDAGITLTGIYNGDLHWADYDNDGDLDVLVTGSTTSSKIAAIYRNDGSNTFTNINAGLTAVTYSSAAWGDFDCDGDLDIIITGTTGSDYSGVTTNIYQNMGSNTFTLLNTDLIDVYKGSVNWGDFDNDGDLDLLLTGTYHFFGYTISKIYKNTLPDSIGFVDINAGLQSAYCSSASLGDYDNDNDLDILLTGSGYSKIYRNDLNTSGKFIDINTSIAAVTYSSCEWGDYDNDGDLDILLSGLVSGSSVSKIYRNDSHEIFTDINANFKNISYGSLSWGDYDNDGDLDVALTGTTDGSSAGRKSKIYQNNGNGTFTDIQSNIDSVYNSSISWADYDNDNDLDLVLAGTNGTTPITKIYRNETVAKNTVPSQPGSFSATFNLNQIELNWNAANDSKTPSAGLSYNFFIADKATGKFKSPAQADTTTGYRTVLQPGMLKTKKVSCKGLKRGNYTCGVQAIDASYSGSSFAKTTFTITNNTPTTPTLVYPTNLQALYTDSVCLKWKTTDYDGDAITYTVKIGTPNNMAIHTQGLTKDSIWVKNLNRGTTYQWQILATDALNATSTSAVQSFTISNIEKESNNSFAQANVSNNGLGFYGTVGNATDAADYFCINYPKNGLLKVSLTNLNNIALTNGGLNTVSVYSSNQNTITSISNYYLDAGETYTSINIKLNANENYYINITPENLTDNVPYHLTFSIDTNLVKDYAELNNSMAAAYSLNSDSISATIGFDNDIEDWYKVTFNGIGTFQVKITNPATFPDISDGLGAVNIYKSTGENVTSISSYNISNGNTFSSQIIGVTAGQYFFIKVIPSTNYSGADYQLKIISSVQSTRIVAAPTIPFPLNIENNDNSVLPTDTLLTWQCSHPDNLPLTYNFYYGKSSPPPIVAKGLTKKEFKIQNINWDDSIFWKVTAFATPTDSVISPIYNFSSRYITKSKISLNGVSNGSADWGDYDNDGYLDLLLTGVTNENTSIGVTKIFKNMGSETLGFTEINAGLPGVYLGNAVWGDYDNDNDLDILITGSTDGTATGAKTKIFRNNGNSTFTDLNAGLPSLFYSNAAWGDYNNDGKLDVAITGSLDGNGTGALSLIYKNNGNGTFTNIDAGLAGLYYSTIEWVDYNNDGFLDLMLTGKEGANSSNPFTAIYKNNKNGTFSKITSNFSQIKDGNAAWGDYDNDGDLDLLLTGSTSSFWSNRIATLYRNNLPVSESFTDIQAGLAVFDFCNAAWGDYDNDGYQDIVISGKNSNGIAESKIYKNNKNSTFTDIRAGLLNFYQGSVSWIDFDNDSDLDMLLTGMQGSTKSTILYKNRIFKKNTPPNPPTKMFSGFTSKGIILGWNCGNDIETDSLGLSYNVAFFDATHNQINSPMADTLSGKRKISSVGKIKTNGLIIDTTSLTSGTYYWKVQSIDGSNTGSAWSKMQSISFLQGIKPLIKILSPVNDSINVKINSSLLKWSATHAANKTMSYNVYFGTNKNNPALVSTNQTGMFYALPKLEYNKTYYWRVEAKDTDGTIVSTLIQKFTTSLNQAPVLSLISPANNSTINSSKALFKWTANDAENENIKYTLQFCGNGWDTVTVTNLIDTLFQIDTLTYNKAYYWWVTAFDSFGNKTQAAYHSFNTGSNSAPNITLTSPNNYSVFNKSDVNLDLVWSASDINNDNLTFTINITSNTGDTMEVFYYSDTVFHIKIDTLIYGATYYWYVTAIDSYGNSASAWKRQFQIENTAPTITLVSPANDSVNAPIFVNLIWQGSDLENEPITYDLNFGTYYYPESYLTNITDTFVTVGPLYPGTIYNWEVIATDSSGNSKTSSVYQFTTFSNNRHEVYLLYPENTNSNMPYELTLTWTATDVENDTLTYNCILIDSSTDDTTFFNNLTDTSVYVSDLKINTTYFWQVTATDKYGISDESDLFHFTTAEKPLGWFKFYVTDVNNKPIGNAQIQLVLDNYIYDNYQTLNTGYVVSNLYLDNNYKVSVSKNGFFSQTKTNLNVAEFDTALVKFELSKMGDFNSDNQMDLTDMDSLVANWRSTKSTFELAPATGTAPNFDVSPDGIFDFEDVMVFSLLWDYYNTNENFVQKSLDGIETNTSGISSLSSKTETLPDNLNSIKFNLLLSNIGDISSVGLQVNYDTRNMQFVSVKNQFLSPYQNILFTQHNANMGLLKISSAILQANNTAFQTDFLTLTFNKLTNDAKTPELFYEIHFTDKTVTSGLLSLQQAQTEISIYPNPTNQYLYIQTPAGQAAIATITITDVLGKILYKTTNSTNELKADVSQFNQKIIFVNVKLGSQVITKKIIVTQEN